MLRRGLGVHGNQASVKPPLSALATALYASGSLGTGVFSTVPTVLLLYFCTEVLHISAAWAAATVFIPKAWAILWDPLVGAWSDRMRSRFGRRRPFLVVGLLGIALFFIAVFALPTLPPLATVVWISCAYFGLATAYSLFAVPYIAIPAEIGTSSAERARLVASRMTVGMVGVLTGAGIAPLLVQSGGGGRSGYAFMSICIALACAVAMLGPVLMMAGRERLEERAPDRLWQDIPRQLARALGNRSFSALTASYLLQLTSVGMITSAMPYLITRAFDRDEGDVGTAMLVMFTATTFCVPLWAWLGRRFSQRGVLTTAALLFGLSASLLSVIAMTGAPWSVAMVAFVLTGISFAGIQVLPFTIVAHLIHRANSATAKSEASYTGIWTAAEKLGLALGPALTGLALSSVRGEIAHGLTKFLVAAPLMLVLLSLPFVRKATVTVCSEGVVADLRGKDFANG